MQSEKDLRSLAKEAKQRLKTGFWGRYKNEVKRSYEAAKEGGINESAVINYYQSKDAPRATKITSKEDEFFLKVKAILDEKGQVGNIISLLIDHSVYDAMPYDKKQKYILELSGKYLKALDRYNAEKRLF